MILAEGRHNIREREKEAEHRRKMEDEAFLDKWRQYFQLQVLKEMLFESADKLGRTKEEMEAEFGRRWKTLLDASLQRLEDKDPNLAGRVDDRTEDEIPPQ